MKNLFLTIIVSLALSGIGFSQDTIPVVESSNSYTDLGAEIVSTYVWRGFLVDAAPNIQGFGEFGVAGFNFGIWASSNFTGTFAEADFYAGYSVGNFSISIIDYFAGMDNFFTFDKEKTVHAGEVGLAYTLSEKFPLQISVATVIYGADKKIESVDTNGDPIFSEDQNYSTYIELMYPITHGKTEINLVVGGVTHESSFYDTDKATIINIGVNLSKEIKISNGFKLPISLRVSANPKQERIYTVFGISF